MSYSQRDEERVIVKHFGDFVGTYLDCGAYDGRTFSNTRRLAELGWKGVCVEPAAAAFAAMVKDPPPGAKLVNALVGARTGLASFLHSEDAVSTARRSFSKRWAKTVTYTPVFVGAVTVDDLLVDFPGPYHFVSIDCEGESRRIFRAFRPLLDRLETELICVEHDGAPVYAEGFTEVYRSEENVILERK